MMVPPYLATPPSRCGIGPCDQRSWPQYSHRAAPPRFSPARFSGGTVTLYTPSVATALALGRWLGVRTTGSRCSHGGEEVLV